MILWRESMKRRVIAALLTAAVAVETIGMPLCAMASEVVPELSSVVEDTTESTAEEDAETIEKAMQSSVVNETVSSVISDVDADVIDGGSEVLSGGENTADTAAETEKEPDKADTPLLMEEKMLYAHADAEQKKIVMDFTAFADQDEYTYEICDAKGTVLKTDALSVEKKETKGDLAEVFEAAEVFETQIDMDESWPEEIQIKVYDKAGTSYIQCSLKKETPVSSAAAAVNGDDKVDVVWTNDKDCDGYVIELLNENDQLVDSQTLEEASACTFTAVEADLHVQITPYTQEEDAAPVYYVSTETAVAPLEAAAQNAVDTQSASIAVQSEQQIIPGGIGNISATAGDQQVVLNWAAAANATAYRVYIQNQSTGAMEVLTTVTTTNCTVNNLRSGVSYWFAVEAIRDDNGALTVGQRSYAVEARPYMTVPEAPTGLAGNNNNGATTLTWYAGGLANGYVVYRYNYSKNRYDEIGRTTATSFTDQRAGDTGKQKYAVRSYRTEDNVNFLYSETWPEVLVYGSKTVSDGKAVRPIYYSAKITRKTGLYGKFRKDETKQGTIKPGKKVTIIYRRWKQSLVSYQGKKYYIYNGAMRVNGQSYTQNDYSTQTKEYYVNSKGYKSKSKYLIWISTYTQRVNVFEGSKGNWKLIRSERCVTGKMSTYTPLGEFPVSKKKYAHYYGRNFYKYLTYFRGDNKMHTRPARRKGGKYLNATMGKPLSNGCVRLTDSLAKWVYNNVPKKATVLVY